MTTQAAMIAEIEDDLERSDTAAIRTKIAASIRHYQKTRFWFNESRDVTFNTVASQIVYGFGAGSDITTEFYRIDGAFLTENTNIHQLRRVDYRPLEVELDGNIDDNRPTAYAYVNRSIRLYPPPNGVYAVRLTGHIRIDPPAADDTADNEWMVEGYDLIKARTKSLLFAVRYMDPTNAAVERQAEADALDMLLGASGAKTGSGCFIPTQF